MKQLEKCLYELSTGHQSASLSADILCSALGLSPGEARMWIIAFGDPLVDWKASALLAVNLGLNADVIKATCEASKGIEPLAVAMTRLTIEAILAFSTGDDEISCQLGKFSKANCPSA